MANPVGRGRRLKLKAIAGGVLLASAIMTLCGCGGSSQSFQAATSPLHNLKSIKISPATATVPYGDSERFAATGIFSDGSVRDLTSTVTWTSARSDIAAIEQSGIAIARGPGLTLITAESGSMRASATLTVPQLTLVSITIVAPNLSLAKGAAEQLNAIGSYVDGSTKDLSGSVTWTSSAPGIVVATATGSITGAGPGTATITASSGAIRGAEQITVPQATLVSLAITPSSSSLTKGSSQQLAVTGTLSDGSTRDVTGSVAWTVYPASIATVSATGMVSTLAAGAATITAVSGSSKATAILTVAAPTLTSLSISPLNPSLAKGGSKQLTVSGAFSDGTKQDMTNNVAWTSSSSNVTVSNGMVTAMANGTAVVTATSGTITASDTITVSAPSLVSLAISPANPSLVIGKTQQLAVAGTFSDGSTQDVTATVSWTIPPTNIVAVSNTGLVTALATGTTTVNAVSGPVSASGTITVSAASLVSIAILPASPSVAKGATQQLSATGTYNDGSTQDLSSKVLWSSSPSGMVDVNNAGLLTGKTLGTATVVASSGTTSGTAAVTVSAAIPISLGISPANSFVTLGTSQQLKAFELLSDGTTQGIKSSVTWTSGNSAIAAINSSGVATARGIGTATISVTGDSLTGSTTLNVEPMKSVEYFNQANTPGIDETIRVSSPGFGGDKMCAMVYVFAPDQQLSECCGCMVTRNGLRTFSLNTDLTSNPLTGKLLTDGTVQIVPANPTAISTCDPTNYTPAGSLSTWATHIGPVAPGSFNTIDSHAQIAPLSSTDLPYLQNQCQFLNALGSGQGTCTCGTGD